MNPAQRQAKGVVRKLIRKMRLSMWAALLGFPTKEEPHAVEYIMDFPFTGKNTHGDYLFTHRPRKPSESQSQREMKRVEFFNKATTLSLARPVETLLTRAYGKMRMMREQRLALQETNKLGEWPISGRLPGEPMAVFLKTRDGKLHLLPPPEEVTDVIAVSPFAPDLESYWDRLQACTAQSSVGEREKAEVRAIARQLVLIHKQYPAEKMKKRREVYALSLDFLIERIDRLLRSPSQIALAPAEAEGFLALARQKFALWQCPDERTRRIMGDVHPGNILFRKGKEECLVIDPQTDGKFPQSGEAALDTGTLFTDLWLLSHVYRNGAFRERGELLLDYYQQESGDKNVRRAVACIALPYRTAQLLHPEYAEFSGYAKVIEPSAAQSFFRDMWEFMQAGTC